MIKPWVGYVVVAEVDHDDVVRVTEPSGPLEEMTNMVFTGQREHKVPQGIVAGVVVETGEGVPDLAPGSKVFYVGSSAILIEGVKLVHANYIVAWEEP